MRKFIEKRTWVRAHLGDISSDAELLTAFAKHFGMRDEGRASQELREILDADASVEEHFEGISATRHLALGQRLLNMMVADKAFGPASVVWKAMSQVKGLEQQRVQVEVSGAPSAEIVRARIAKLMADQRVHAQAEAIGVDLDEQAKALGVDPDETANTRENPIPSVLLRRRGQGFGY